MGLANIKVAIKVLQVFKVQLVLKVTQVLKVRKAIQEQMDVPFIRIV
jgi:hypothetical protein